MASIYGVNQNVVRNVRVDGTVGVYQIPQYSQHTQCNQPVQRYVRNQLLDRSIENIPLYKGVAAGVQDLVGKQTSYLASLWYLFRLVNATSHNTLAWTLIYLVTCVYLYFYYFRSNATRVRKLHTQTNIIFINATLYTLVLFAFIFSALYFYLVWYWYFSSPRASDLLWVYQTLPSVVMVYYIVWYTVMALPSAIDLIYRNIKYDIYTLFLRGFQMLFIISLAIIVPPKSFYFSPWNIDIIANIFFALNGLIGGEVSTKVDANLMHVKTTYKPRSIYPLIPYLDTIYTYLYLVGCFINMYLITNILLVNVSAEYVWLLFLNVMILILLFDSTGWNNFTSYLWTKSKNRRMEYIRKANKESSKNLEITSSIVAGKNKPKNKNIDVVAELTPAFDVTVFDFDTLPIAIQDGFRDLVHSTNTYCDLYEYFKTLKVPYEPLIQKYIVEYFTQIYNQLKQLDTSNSIQSDILDNYANYIMTSSKDDIAKILDAISQFSLYSYDYFSKFICSGKHKKHVYGQFDINYKKPYFDIKQYRDLTYYLTLLGYYYVINSLSEATYQSPTQKEELETMEIIRNFLAEQYKMLLQYYAPKENTQLSLLSLKNLLPSDMLYYDNMIQRMYNYMAQNELLKQTETWKKYIDSISVYLNTDGRIDMYKLENAKSFDQLVMYMTKLYNIFSTIYCLHKTKANQALLNVQNTYKNLNNLELATLESFLSIVGKLFLVYAYRASLFGSIQQYKQYNYYVSKFKEINNVLDNPKMTELERKWFLAGLEELFKL